MKQFFRELFEYSHHYNQKLFQLFIDKREILPADALKLFNHILNAHHIWNHRILGIPNEYQVWQEYPLDTCGKMDVDNYQKSINIINEKDLDVIIEYKTSNGQPFKNSVRDILFHTVNHTSYHRAQIAKELRINNIDPIATDYIFYKR